MRRTGSLAFVLVLTIGIAACSGGSKGGEAGLQIIDTIVGTGAEAKLGDTITAQYTGYLEDGTIFDGPAIHGGPAQFQLAVGSLIQGWTDGVPGMKVGGKRRLVIPPALAYGASGRGQIPPNATLTFDIELVSIP
jgi:FKBP-type peptidyl-prolyl cis-trans isomerase